MNMKIDDSFPMSKLLSGTALPGVLDWKKIGIMEEIKNISYDSQNRVQSLSNDSSQDGSLNSIKNLFSRSLNFFKGISWFYTRNTEPEPLRTLDENNTMFYTAQSEMEATEEGEYFNISTKHNSYYFEFRARSWVRV